MKITIDTKEDSHEEIQQIITVLASLTCASSPKKQEPIFSNMPLPEAKPSKQEVPMTTKVVSEESTESIEDIPDLLNLFPQDPEPSNAAAKPQNSMVLDEAPTEAELKIEPKEVSKKKDAVDFGIPQLEEYND